MRPAGVISRSETRRSGLGNGRRSSRTDFTTVKMVVVAPMPKASAARTTTVNPRDLRRVRAAYRKSCRARSNASAIAPAFKDYTAARPHGYKLHAAINSLGGTPANLLTEIGTCYSGSISRIDIDSDLPNTTSVFQHTNFSAKLRPVPVLRIGVQMFCHFHLG